MPRLSRLLAAAACAALLASVPAALGGLADRKQEVDARIAELREEVERAKESETVLTSDIEAASERIELVEAEVGALSERVGALERELARERARLARLRERHADLSRQLAILKANERVAEERLEARLVKLYTTELPDELEILLGARSLDDLVSGLEYLRQIAETDRSIASAVEAARQETAGVRREVGRARAQQAEATALVAERTAEQRAALSELVGRRDELRAAQGDRLALLTTVRSGREEAEEDLEELERASAELEARIRAAQRATGAAAASSGGGAAPASGFVWPVSGPVTSPFGLRWGRLHAGIDIGAGFGTPIAAAAAGTVIHAGWLGGYGNLVVVDHGNGLATAYAHQQRIYVSVGQSVGQGETLGEVGSTGFSTGPHLHFEVRVNGSAVDPLGYL